MSFYTRDWSDLDPILTGTSDIRNSNYHALFRFPHCSVTNLTDSVGLHHSPFGWLSHMCIYSLEPAVDSPLFNEL